MSYSLTIHKSWYMKDDELFTVNYDLSHTNKTIEEVVAGWEDAGYIVLSNIKS